MKKQSIVVENLLILLMLAICLLIPIFCIISGVIILLKYIPNIIGVLFGIGCGISAAMIFDIIVIIIFAVFFIDFD